MGVAGSTKIGDFELLAKLGEGGMGAVYRARMISQNRICALKILPPRAAEDAEYLQRFFREARATAQLNHPNIVKAYAAGTVEGYHVFAMELVEGNDLKQRTLGLQKLSEDEIVVIGTAIAAALAHAHDSGIVHRDVKPENILMDMHGTPKLSDLGLVQLEGDSSLTQSGCAVGTPHYMSPEQSRGDGEVDARSDIYSLGCTLYFAATGRTPFNGPSPSVLMLKHLKDKMPHPQSLNPELSDDFCLVLERMCARAKEDRYPDMHAVHDDLQRLLEDEAPLAKPLPPGKANFALEGSPSSTSIHMPVGVPRQSKTSVPRLRETRRSEAKKVEPAERKRPPWPLIGGGAAALLLLVLGYFAISAKSASSEKQDQKSTPRLPKLKENPKVPPNPLPPPLRRGQGRKRAS